MLRQLTTLAHSTLCEPVLKRLRSLMRCFSLPLPACPPTAIQLTTNHRYTNAGKDKAKYKEAKQLEKSVWVELNGSWHELKFHVLHKTGVDYVFIEHIAFERPGTPYGDHTGPFKDNLFRWVCGNNLALKRWQQGCWWWGYAHAARGNMMVVLSFQLACDVLTLSLYVLGCCHRFTLLCLGGLEAPLNLPIKRDK